MNANELADVLEDLHEQDKIDGVAHLAMPEAATMLRQQAHHINNLLQWQKRHLDVIEAQQEKLTKYELRHAEQRKRIEELETELKLIDELVRGTK